MSPKKKIEIENEDSEGWEGMAAEAVALLEVPV